MTVNPQNSATATGSTARPLRLGLRTNAAQFVLLVAVNALVGGMVGQQQTVLPLLATEVFGLSGFTFIFMYVAAFGASKAIANYVAGALSDRYGRKPVLVAGWILALPVPALLIVAEDWSVIILANVLLGISQGLTWSTTVIMKIDLVGPRQRGLAMGLNEAAGYGAVAVTSLFAGTLASEFGLRPAPFLLGLAYAALALMLSLAFVRETRPYAQLEANRAALARTPAAAHSEAKTPDQFSPAGSREIVAWVSFREKALASASHVGMVNNLNFGLAWGLFPLLFATAALPLHEIGVLFALYPAVWGVGQIITGALSDRLGRKWLIVGGMVLQSFALAIIALSGNFATWAMASALLGAGTAMVYPTLLATVGDVAHPTWRGRAVGVYRVWRDLGYAVGAICGGIIADTWDLRAAVWFAVGISLAAAVAAAVRMYETHPELRKKRMVGPAGIEPTTSTV